MTENLDRVHMICQICENEDEDDPRRLHPDSDVTELCHDIPRFLLFLVSGPRRPPMCFPCISCPMRQGGVLPLSFRAGR